MTESAQKNVGSRIVNIHDQKSCCVGGTLGTNVRFSVARLEMSKYRTKTSKLSFFEKNYRTRTKRIKYIYFYNNFIFQIFLQPI